MNWVEHHRYNNHWDLDDREREQLMKYKEAINEARRMGITDSESLEEYARQQYLEYVDGFVWTRPTRHSVKAIHESYDGTLRWPCFEGAPSAVHKDVFDWLAAQCPEYSQLEESKRNDRPQSRDRTARDERGLKG